MTRSATDVLDGVAQHLIQPEGLEDFDRIDTWLMKKGSRLSMHSSSTDNDSTTQLLTGSQARDRDLPSCLHEDQQWPEMPIAAAIPRSRRPEAHAVRLRKEGLRLEGQGLLSIDILLSLFLEPLFCTFPVQGADL